MTVDNSTRERVKAASATAFGNLRSKTDANTKRMAGAALAAVLAPSAIGMVDGRDSDFISDFAGGGLSVAATGLGGYLGYQQGTIPADGMDAFIDNELATYKAEAKEIARTSPQEGVEHFAAKKQQLLADIAPIDPKRAQALNATLRQMPEFGGMLADLDIANKSPRQVRGLSKGAAIGAVASALPAYLLMRGEES
jgi:hypothetical protein